MEPVTSQVFLSSLTALLCTVLSSMPVLTRIFLILLWHFARNLSLRGRLHYRGASMGPETSLQKWKLPWNQRKGAWRRFHLSPWVAEERGCSCEIVSSPYLLDFVAKVSIALVGKSRGEKPSEDILAPFFVANRYFFCLCSKLLEAVCISPAQRLIQHITGCDLNKVIRSYMLDLQREWELLIW